MTTPQNKGDRQTKLDQLKAQARKLMKRSWMPSSITERNVGKQASVHSVECSCSMCGNPRKHLGQRTLQEIKASLPD